MGYVFKNGILTKTKDGSEEKPAEEPVQEKPEEEPVKEKPSRSKRNKAKNLDAAKGE